MKQLVDWMIGLRIANMNSAISSKFEGFRRLLAIDSTVIQLHDMLTDIWESTQPNQAATKLHVIANVIDGKTNSVQLTDQPTHDTEPWKRIGKWVQDSLLMMDLAYYDFHLFHRIDQQDGFFISRVKSSANPDITGSNITCPGRSIELAGKKLQEVIRRLHRRVLDVTVEVAIQLRKYRGSRNMTQKQFRMAGVRNDETVQYICTLRRRFSAACSRRDRRGVSVALAGRIAVQSAQIEIPAPPATGLEAPRRQNPDLRLNHRAAGFEPTAAGDVQGPTESSVPATSNGRGIPGLCTPGTVDDCRQAT